MSKQKTILELEAEKAANERKIAQLRHKEQQLENRIMYYQQGDRKKRNHRLITRGAAVESVVPEVRGMSERAFYLLVERLFSLPEVRTLVSHATEQTEGG